MTPEQQQVTAQFIQEAIGIILLIVLVAWGIRQVGRAIGGKPVEQIPL